MSCFIISVCASSVSRMLVILAIHMRAWCSLPRVYFSLLLFLLLPPAFDGSAANGNSKREVAQRATPQAQLQVSEVLPPLSLPPLFRNASKSSWSSFEHSGQAPLLLVLLDSHLKPQGQTMWLESVQRVVQPIPSNVAEVAIIVSRTGPLQPAQATAPKVAQPLLPVLLDAKHRLSQAFNVPSQGAAFVTIDRAGFIRRIEHFSTLPDVMMLGARLQAFNDLPRSLEVGKPAPDFMLRDMNGSMRRLSAMKGRKHLLLTFFPRCFTGNCTQQVVSLQKSLPELKANDVEVWGVSVDPAEGPNGQRAFAIKHGLKFPLIPDVGRSLSILYGAAQSPNQLASRMSVLIDKQGIVRWIDKQMDVKTHGQDVMTKLHELGLSMSKSPGTHSLNNLWSTTG